VSKVRSAADFLHLRRSYIIVMLFHDTTVAVNEYISHAQCRQTPPGKPECSGGVLGSRSPATTGFFDCAISCSPWRPRYPRWDYTYPRNRMYAGFSHQMGRNSAHKRPTVTSTESAQFQFQSADSSDVMISGPEQKRTERSESRERICD